MTIIKEIYDLFEQLTQPAQIERVMQLMEMPNDWRPSKHTKLYNAKTEIVSWAEGKENGEDYRLERLKNLKTKIIFVIGEINLPSKQHRKESVEQKFAELLSSLNCDEQLKSFCQVLNSQSGGVFLIQAMHDEIQRWLVQRLVNYQPSLATGKQIYIKTQKHNVRWNFEAFWTEFNSVCKNPSCDSVIQELTELCKTKSIVITIYGLRLLNENNRRQLYNFWLRLWEQFRQLEKHSFLVLFLVEENNANCKLSPFKFIESTYVGEYQQNILLPPLDNISSTHVRSWLTTEQVISQLKIIFPKRNLNNIVEHYHFEEEEPLALLNEICQEVFQIQDGIAAIEPYWKLAG
ncbi:hypothetical protein SAMD00079811_35740 [Scytonema sp. HK-05]|uniref:hypothetical protein n=1 Tax=Scytonema sp. HK-05 TaxID=1137095 RepID=UPI00093599B9|nr:hypothetical protein [Scytonema sp. HK-05]OKH60575.1 hypothetical protein NIES2130_02325 [Scytonema sp. HK-05]BAY45967.1 hypothetical protein SAMD00079811_35740 [Scytonema sp. HK-05]